MHDAGRPPAGDVKRKSQAAAEFMSVYGFAILGIAVMAILLYVFVIVPSTAVPNQCNFPEFLSCKSISMGSNSVLTRAVLILSNTGAYALENATATVNVTGTGSSSAACSPSFILPGGLLECIINFSNTITPYQLKSGSLYLAATICTSPSQYGCASPSTQVLGGTYSVHVSPLLPTPSCSVSLSVQNSTQYSGTGAKDTLTANVRILGINLTGATVKFTPNSSLAYVSPEYSNTDSKGNAVSYASSDYSAAFDSGVTATFGACSSSTKIRFTPQPVYYYLGVSHGSGGTALPHSGSYRNGTTVALSATPDVGYSFSSWTCSGTNCYSGTSPSANITMTSNVIENASFKLNSYSLTMSASPSAGGTLSPGSGIYYYGNTVTISETPASGYTFNGWSCTGQGCYSGSSSSATITMVGNVTETAYYNAPVPPAILSCFTEYGFGTQAMRYAWLDCITSNGLYQMILADESGSGLYTWTYLYSNPPGVSPGSYVYCGGYSNGPGSPEETNYMVCTDPSGTYYMEIYAGGTPQGWVSWPEGTPPGGASAGYGTSCNPIYGSATTCGTYGCTTSPSMAWDCVTGQGSYISGYNSWSTYSSAPPGITSAGPLSCPIPVGEDDGLYPLGSYYQNLWMCVNPSGTYGYNNQSKTWVDVSAAPSGTASGGALSCFPYNQLSNQAHLCVTPSGTYSSGSSAFLSSTAVTKQCTGGSTYTQPTCAYNPAMSTYVTNTTSCTTASAYAGTTSCTNYAYLPASGSWSYVTGAPPGTADGSPVSCVQSTPNINVDPSYSYFYVCVTPSGTYGFPDGTDSWSYYGAAPPGA